MKFRVPQARVKAPKQTRATTAAGAAKPSSSRKKRKGPHTDLPEDPIEEPMPLYGDDDANDQDFAPMDEEPTVEPKTWPPTRSTRARGKAPESQASTSAETFETQQTVASSSGEPIEGCYEELIAFRDMVRLRFDFLCRWSMLTGMLRRRSQTRKVSPILIRTLPRKPFKRSVRCNPEVYNILGFFSQTFTVFFRYGSFR